MTEQKTVRAEIRQLITLEVQCLCGHWLNFVDPSGEVHCSCGRSYEFQFVLKNPLPGDLEK